MERVKLKDMLLRAFLMTLGMSIFTFGMAAFLAVGWGASAMTTFQEALLNRFHISFGVSNVIYNAIILCAFFFWDRKFFHVGTLVILLIPGYVMDFAKFALSFLFEAQLSLPVCVLLLAIGSVLCGLGMSIYFPTAIGLGAQDMLVLKIQEILKSSFKTAYYLMNGSVLVVGIALGGSWGVGTLISLFVIGLLAEIFMKTIRIPLYKLTHQYERLIKEFPKCAKEQGLSEEEVSSLE